MYRIDSVSEDSPKVSRKNSRVLQSPAKDEKAKGELEKSKTIFEDVPDILQVFKMMLMSENEVVLINAAWLFVSLVIHFYISPIWKSILYIAYKFLFSAQEKSNMNCF